MRNRLCAFIKGLEKKEILACIEFLLVTVFSFEIILNLTYSVENEYQIYIDYSLYKACIWTLALILIINKNSVFSWHSLASLVSLTLITIILFKAKSLNAENYGVNYFETIKMHGLLQAMFIYALYVSLYDFVKGKNKVSISILGYFFIAICIWSAAKNPHSMFPLLCPFLLAFFLTKRKVEYEKLIHCFSWGYLLAFIKLMTQSLIQNPKNYLNGRYIGSFANIATAGMLVGGAILCSIYILVRLRSINEKRLAIYFEIILAIFTLCYSVIFFIKIESRAAIFGIGIAFIVMFCLYNKHDSKKIIKNRVLIVLIITFCFAISIKILSDYGLELITQINDEDKLSSYSYAHIASALEMGEKGTDFNGNKFLNMLDALTSGRITIWREYLNEITLWGNGIPEVTYGGRTTTSPHNFFITMLLTNGLIGGSLIIIWYVWFSIRIITTYIQEKGNLLLVLWNAFCFGFISFERASWNYTVMFVLIFLSAPFCLRKESDLTIANNDGEN